MTPARLESSIERACATEATKHKCVLLKIQGMRGWPDRLLLMPWDKVIWCEFKRPGTDLSPLQAWRMNELRLMGFQAYKVDSVEQFKEILNEALDAAPIPVSRG